jgi:hypothetical protein
MAIAAKCIVTSTNGSNISSTYPTATFTKRDIEMSNALAEISPVTRRSRTSSRLRGGITSHGSLGEKQQTRTMESDATRMQTRNQTETQSHSQTSPDTFVHAAATGLSSAAKLSETCKLAWPVCAVRRNGFVQFSLRIPRCCAW